MTLAQFICTVAGWACLGIAAGYALAVLIGALAWRRFAGRAPRLNGPQPPVTILKPLCGDEPALYEHLRSFCEQRYHSYQLVFGTLDAADPALAIVARLAAQFPQLAIDVVVNPQRHGHNNKSSNLINMMAVARHPVLLIADSDITVGPDYLAAVTAPLGDSGVGLVTCLSYDVPTPGLWSRLGAMYINEWYFPSVMVAWLFGHQDYASGQTLCLRRATLDAIGGLPAFADHLADDYQLGQLIRKLGLRIVLSSYELQAQHHEPDFAALSRHELRWNRTLHAVSPWSFRMIFLTFSLPLAALGLALLSGRWHLLTWTLLWVTAAARVALHLVQRRGRGRPLFADLALVPMRDLLLCWHWGQSFFCRRVTWRGASFHVDGTGVMRRIA
ncbi:MAG TPA: bacteriohopanetetrol glucosamine biosynthesis glycosyltransferase HpnI [Steroidobacteraceae bacterium]|nr:bacteriohopanetetrol glucosamine biosynthesis glycosyltransferase HpnI [Steroidobacteraceae bacterium]